MNGAVGCGTTGTGTGSSMCWVCEPPGVGQLGGRGGSMLQRRVQLYPGQQEPIECINAAGSSYTGGRLHSRTVLSADPLARRPSGSDCNA